jgi:class 3 adenylate cyclase
MPGEDKEQGSARRLTVEELAERLAQADSEREFTDMLATIAEETGASVETLQSTLKEIDQRRKVRRTWWGALRAQLSQMGEATRRTATSAFLGLQAGLVAALGAKFGDDYGLGTVAQVLLIALAIYNTALARRRELAVLVGATIGASYVIGRAFFSVLLQPEAPFDGMLIIGLTLLGAGLGWLVGGSRERILRLRFQHDPEARRKELLRQLIELQDELRVGERTLTFLSVDIVDSTGIKAECEPLAVEYSFGEYSRYACRIAQQFGGTLHSAAGDGLLFAFDHPQHAFLAAKRIQAGMIEFNAHVNRTGRPFRLRCGIHTGRVVTPIDGDPASVNYSHVIDVASHLQKAAPAGGVAVSKGAALLFPGGPSSVGSQPIEVRGIEGVVWTLQSEATPGPDRPSPLAPPPLPGT